MRTRLFKAFGCVITAAFLFPVSAVAATPAAGIVSPYKGVLCDRKAGFCADEQGISMGLTKEYPGAAAEKKLLETTGSDFNGKDFVMMDGTACKSDERVCTTSKYGDTVNSKATLALYGKLPATAKPSKAITFPEAGVICDRTSAFCVDRQGISVAMTRMYLGAPAEAALMKRVRENPDLDLKNYVLINGVDCQSENRVCMAERRGTQVERKYTRHLFGG